MTVSGREAEKLHTTKRIVLAFPVLGVAILWFLLLRPAFLGGPASYIIVAGASMEPTLHTGDLALARQQPAYHEGDIVAFRVPEGQFGEGHIVIHRIVGGTAEEGYVIQGDNKKSPDPWRPTANDVLGRMWFRVPRGGLYVLSLRQPIALGAVAGLLGMLLVLTGGEGAQSGPHQGTRPPGPPAWPGWGVFVLGLLAILAIGFAAVAVFAFRQAAPTITEPALLSLFGLHIPVVTAHWLSAVGFAITGGAATGGLALAAILSRQRGQAARIHARYARLLITVAQSDLKERGQKIWVASIEDLAKLAQRDGRMILHQELGPQSHRYFIQDGPVTYQYMVTNGGSAVEEPKKPKGLTP